MTIEEIQQLVAMYKQQTKGVINYQKYIYYAISHHSTALEGSTLTEKQSIDLLAYGKPAARKPIEEQFMVFDYFKALEYIADQAGQSKPAQLVTVDFIKTIAAKVKLNTGEIVHTILGDFDTSKGDFRLCGVTAGARMFPDHKKVKDLTVKLCNSLNDEMAKAVTFEQKCDIAFRAHFELVSIHPFGDGNGRTSRLLMNFIQARFDIPLSVVYKQDRIKYIDAIESARKKGTIEPFLKFMYAQYAKFMKAEIRRINK